MSARTEALAGEPAELPWSCEAEQSVLGAVMLEPEALLRLADAPLQADHFYDLRHRAIWLVMVELSAASHAIDVITVFEQLQSRGKAEECGGLAYLNALAQSVPSASNLRRYAQIVRERALRRAVIAAADQAMTLAKAPGDSAATLDHIATLFGAIQRPTARSGPRSLAELMAERLTHWNALAQGDVTPGIPTGLANLDEALTGGLRPGKVIVLAARPSVGKTSLAQQIGLTVAAAGHPVLMMSQEMPSGELLDRIAANLGGINLERISNGRLAEGEWGALTAAAEAGARLPFHVDEQPALTLLDIRAKAHRVQQQRRGLALLVVDYLQLCASSGPVNSRHHQIEQISRGLKQLAKELDTCVLVLSQLKRNSDAEPELDHLKESGAIEEDADTVILLHPMGVEPDGAMTVLAKVPKNRSGRRGRLALAFTGRTQRWATSTANVSRRQGAPGGVS